MKLTNIKEFSNNYITHLLQTLKEHNTTRTDFYIPYEREVDQSIIINQQNEEFYHPSKNVITGKIKFTYKELQDELNSRFKNKLETILNED